MATPVTGPAAAARSTVDEIIDDVMRPTAISSELAIQRDVPADLHKRAATSSPSKSSTA